MRPQRGGPLGQQQVGATGPVTEEQQHRGVAPALGRRQEPAELLGPHRLGRPAHRQQPVGQPVPDDRHRRTAALHSTLPAADSVAWLNAPGAAAVPG